MSDATPPPKTTDTPQNADGAKPFYLRPSTYLVLAVLVIAGYFASQRIAEKNKPAPEAPPRPPVSVSAIKAPKGIIRTMVRGTGTARAVRSELLAFESSGRVIEISKNAAGEPLKAGDIVNGPSEEEPLGQLLARIDATDKVQNLKLSEVSVSQSRQDVRSASASLNQAKSDLALARAQLKRTEELYKNNEASAAQLETSKAQVNSAKANVAARRAQVSASRSGVTGAKAKLTQSERDKLRTEIRAPFTGMLAAVNVRLGDMTSANAVDNSSRDRQLATSPFVLIDPGTYEAVVELPSFQAKSVRPGLPAVVMDAETALLDFTKVKDPRTLPIAFGFVHAVDRAISPGARSVRVTIRIARGVHLLKDGQFVSTIIVTREKSDVVVAPLDAVVFRDNKPFAFVVDPKTNAVTRRALSVGLASGATLEVTKGLAEGELVVTDGRHRLTGGAKVKVVEEQVPSIGWQGRVPSKDGAIPGSPKLGPPPGEDVPAKTEGAEKPEATKDGPEEKTAPKPRKASKKSKKTKSKKTKKGTK